MPCIVSIPLLKVVLFMFLYAWHAPLHVPLTHSRKTFVTLQAMILVEDPYYNEPAHEAARGTDTGRSSAAMYNANLTLQVGVPATSLHK